MCIRDRAGGYGFRAKKSKAYIVYMNGQVKRAKKGSRELDVYKRQDFNGQK